MEFVSTFSLNLKAVKTNDNDILWVDNPGTFPIDGAIYIPNFLTVEEEEKLVSIFDSNPYQQVIRRRQQFYGPTYYHTTHHLKCIQPTDDREDGYSLDFGSLKWLIDKLFDPKCTRNHEIFRSDHSNDPDQILVNEYIGNMGISTHFDDFDAFGDVIATVSLLNPLFMTLQCPTEINNHCTDLKENGNVRILLEPRSLFVMKGDCRYKWRHGITRHKLVFLPEGRGVLKRDEEYRRISATIRKLGNGRKRIKQSDLGWVDPHLRREIPITERHGMMRGEMELDEHSNDDVKSCDDGDEKECDGKEGVYENTKRERFREDFICHRNNLRWPLV